MPPSESTMPLCDLLAQVRSYWLGEERRVEEECQQRGVELALADRKLETKHKRALRMLQRGKIDSHDLFVRHSDTHDVLADYEVEAKKTYAEEQFKRSGKSFTDFFFTPNVWDFCRQELVKVVPEALTENELDDYLARVTLREIVSSCRVSVELARLHQQGFTTKLLTRILTEYPNDAKAMKLPRAATCDTSTGVALTRTKRAKRITKVVKRSRAKQDDFTDREKEFLDCWTRGLSMAEIKDDMHLSRSRVFQLRKSAESRNPKIFAQAVKERESVIEKRRSALPKANPRPSQKSAQIRSMKKADKERAARRKRA